MSNVPETSKEAYKSLVPAELNETYKKIIQALTAINEGTFEDISAYLREDKSKIWKRLSELATMQVIYRPGNKRKLRSGRNGFTWMLCNPAKVETDIKSTKPISEYSKNISEIKNTVIQPDLF